MVKINMKLLPVKAHYFLYNGGTAAWQPFITVFARQLGISEVGVGSMYAVLPFAGLIARPMLGALADKFSIHRAVFLISILVVGVAFTATTAIPPLPHEQKGHLLCTSDDSYLKVKVADSCLLEQLENSGIGLTCDMICKSLDPVKPDDCSAWNLTEEACTNFIDFHGTFNLTRSIWQNGTMHLKIQDLFVEGNKTSSHCHSRTEMHCDINCNNPMLMGQVRTPVPVDDAYGTVQFISLFSINIVAWAAMAVCVSFTDSLTFAILGPRHDDYGVQRLWGAVGWGLLIALTGWFIGLASEGLPYTNYLPCFIILAGMMGLDLVVASRIKAKVPPPTNSAFAEALRLLVTPSMVIFLLSIILTGACTGFLWQFLFWYIEDLAKASGCSSASSVKLLQGLVGGVQCLCGELPFFFLSGWIIKKIGHIHSMTLVLLVFGVRLCLYSVITNPWYFLPVELLQGVTLGLFWATMASYAHVVAPPGVAATMQGIVGATFEGVGTALGSFVGGIVYNVYGGQWAYMIFGVAALIGGVVHCLLNLLIKKICPLENPAARIEDFNQIQYKNPMDAVTMRDISED